MQKFVQNDENSREGKSYFDAKKRAKKVKYFYKSDNVRFEFEDKFLVNKGDFSKVAVNLIYISLFLPTGLKPSKHPKFKRG